MPPDLMETFIVSRFESEQDARDAGLRPGLEEWFSLKRLAAPATRDEGRVAGIPRRRERARAEDDGRVRSGARSAGDLVRGQDRSALLQPRRQSLSAAAAAAVRRAAADCRAHRCREPDADSPRRPAGRPRDQASRHWHLVVRPVTPRFRPSIGSSIRLRRRRTGAGCHYRFSFSPTSTPSSSACPPAAAPSIPQSTRQ